MGRLSRLARLYGLRLADLVPEPRHPDPLVVRADDRRAIHYGAEGIDVEILIPEGPHGLQALLSTLSPRAAMKDFVLGPNEVFVFVLEGKVRTEFADGRELVLEAGDSAAYVSGEGGHRHDEPRRHGQPDGRRDPPSRSRSLDSRFALGSSP